MHSNIKFTQEFEHNNHLPFLDVLIEKENSNFSLSTYRKSNHTGLYTKWSSFIPMKYKINLIKSLIDEAYKISSSYLIMHNKFINISKMLKNNGFSLKIIDKHIKIYLNNKHQDTNSRKQHPSKASDYIFPVRLPFIGPISYQIQRELNQLFYKKFSDKQKPLVIHETTKIQDYFRFKEKQSLLHNNGVIYQLQCSCTQTYFGQTQRNLISRLKEHHPSTTNNSEVSSHLQNNPDHMIDFYSPDILGYSNNWRKRTIKETQIIQKLEPQLNNDDASQPLYLFNC